MAVVLLIEPYADEGSCAETQAIWIGQATVPDIGDSKDVAVIEVLVKAGETITVEAPVIVLETEPEQLLRVLAQHETPMPDPAG